MAVKLGEMGSPLIPLFYCADEAHFWSVQADELVLDDELPNEADQAWIKARRCAVCPLCAEKEDQ